MTSCFSKKIEEYYSLKPTKFGFVCAIELTQGFGEDGVMEQRLSILLATCHEKGSANKLLLNFRGVRNLEIKQSSLSQLSIPHLEILAGHDLPQIQGKYLVRDPEQERIVWFECEDFAAQLQ